MLLQRAIAERVGGLEDRPVLENEVLLEEEREHLPEVGGEAGRRWGTLSIGGGELDGGVEADVGEAHKGGGDVSEVRREVDAGDITGVRGRGRCIKHGGWWGLGELV